MFSPSFVESALLLPKMIGGSVGLLYQAHRAMYVYATGKHTTTRKEHSHENTGIRHRD